MTLEDTVRMVEMASKITVVAPQTQQCRRVEFRSQLCVLKDHRAEAQGFRCRWFIPVSLQNRRDCMSRD